MKSANKRVRTCFLGATSLKGRVRLYLWHSEQDARIPSIGVGETGGYGEVCYGVAQQPWASLEPFWESVSGSTGRNRFSLPGVE